MLVIDGREGEGGGQVLRTALGLSLVTGTPVRVENIRARRTRPGLLHQHLTAVRAAVAVGGAEAIGDELHSDMLSFTPGPVRGGTYAFDVGTAGSATLVLQTVLPALLRAEGPSAVTVRGGTHNPHAPPFEFLAECFFPLLRRMGAGVQGVLERHGFYPAGGGAVRVDVTPGPLAPLELMERGRIVRREAVAAVANLPAHIAEREIGVVAKELGWKRKEMAAREVDAEGPGNVLTLLAASETACEVVTGFGERGLAAETVARRAAKELRRWPDAHAPVGAHLADHLLVPLALAGGGRFRTVPPSGHTRTNAAVIERFLPVRFRLLDDAIEVES